MDALTEHDMQILSKHLSVEYITVMHQVSDIVKEKGLVIDRLDRAYFIMGNGPYQLFKALQDLRVPRSIVVEAVTRIEMNTAATLKDLTHLIDDPRKNNA